MFLKTSHYWSLFLIINHLLQNTYGACFWIIVAANTFLQLNMVFIADNRTGWSSHQRCSVSKGVPRNFAKLTGKHKCQGLFFNKVEGLRAATLLKKGLLHRCFPVNFAKFLRTLFLQNTYGRLLLPVFVLDSLTTRVKPQKQPLKLFCKKGILRKFANFTGK